MLGESVVVVQEDTVAVLDDFRVRHLGRPAARAARLGGRVMFLFRFGYRMKGDAPCT